MRRRPHRWQSGHRRIRVGAVCENDRVPGIQSEREPLVGGRRFFYVDSRRRRRRPRRIASLRVANLVGQYQREGMRSVHARSSKQRNADVDGARIGQEGHASRRQPNEIRYRICRQLGRQKTRTASFERRTDQAASRFRRDEPAWRNLDANAAERRLSAINRRCLDCETDLGDVLRRGFGGRARDDREESGRAPRSPDHVSSSSRRRVRGDHRTCRMGTDPSRETRPPCRRSRRRRRPTAASASRRRRTRGMRATGRRASGIRSDARSRGIRIRKEA